MVSSFLNIQNSGHVWLLYHSHSQRWCHLDFMVHWHVKFIHTLFIFITDKAMFSVGTYNFMIEIIFHACRHLVKDVDFWLQKMLGFRDTDQMPRVSPFCFFMSVQIFFPIIRVVVNIAQRSLIVTIKIHNPNTNPPSTKLQNYKCRKDNRFQ